MHVSTHAMAWDRIRNLEGHRPEVVVNYTEAELASTNLATGKTESHMQIVRLTCAHLIGPSCRSDFPMPCFSPAIEPIRQLGLSLRSLSLCAVPLSSDTCLDSLAGLLSLCALRIERCPALPNAALRALKRLEAVELVSFNGCASLTDQARDAPMRPTRSRDTTHSSRSPRLHSLGDGASVARHTPLGRRGPLRGLDLWPISSPYHAYTRP